MTELKIEQWPIDKKNRKGKYQVPEERLDVEWRDIPNKEGYMANSLGEIWSKDRRIEKTRSCGKKYIAILKGRKIRPWNTNVYLYCSLGRGLKCGVHKLVCMAFHGMPKDEKLQVAHLDGNPHNNTPENLAWATAYENTQMKRLHGTYYKGKAHFKKPWHKKRGPKPTIHPEAYKMIEMRNNGAKWDEIAKAFGMSRSGVFGVVKYRSGGPNAIND